MEPIMGSAIAEGEWSYLSGMYNTEEAEFMAQLLGNFPVSTEFDGNSVLGNSSSSSSSTFWPSNHGAYNEGSYNSLDMGSIFFPSSSSQEGFNLSDSHPILGTNNNNNNNNNNNHSSISVDFCLGGANYNTSSYLMDQVIDDHECLNNQENFSGTVNKQELGFPVKNLQLKNESDLMQAAESVIEEKLNNPSESSKKRSRNTTDVQKIKRNVKSKKNQKRNAGSASNNEEDNDTNDKSNESNSGVNRLQPSSSCCSEDETNASQDQNGGEGSIMSSKGKAALNLNGKSRASRGSATDPQSLYARKRRERINERLKILQNLVPNGTKVDISTMLEEAVQYVKFLQLQIKLLSSDDLWMYAPIAYNGMNIGLDHLKLAAASKLS